MFITAIFMGIQWYTMRARLVRVHVRVDSKHRSRLSPPVGIVRVQLRQTARGGGSAGASDRKCEAALPVPRRGYFVRGLGVRGLEG
eukprot:244019-Pyramimonas_sp.AAC.1